MGWLIGGAHGRKEIIRDILAKYPDRVDHATSGNELYIVIKTGVGPDMQDAGDGYGRVILCYKLAGYKEDGWGYKDMSEDMGPYMHKCPERLLKQSTCMNEYAIKWRENCRQLRKTVNGANALVKALEAGMKVKTVSFGVLTFLFHQRGIVCRNEKGETYRYKRSHFVDAQIVK